MGPCGSGVSERVVRMLSIEEAVPWKLSYLVGVVMVETRLFSTTKSKNDSGGSKMLIFVSPIMVMEVVGASV